MAGSRRRPPDDITPEAFFTEWVPRAIADDPHRRSRLGGDAFALQFEIEGAGIYSLEIDAGRAHGRVGSHQSPHLWVCVDLETWRQLNRGDLSAPQAFLRRRVRLRGDLRLAVRLHLILG